MFEASFSLQNPGRSPNRKKIPRVRGGGVLRAPRILYAEILRVFYLRLTSGMTPGSRDRGSHFSIWRDFPDCALELLWSFLILGLRHGPRVRSPKAVIIKPVGRIFEISDSNPIWGKCRKCGRSLSP